MALNFPIAALPAQIFILPFGSWGISYDISTNLTQHDAPDGWNAHRSKLFNFMAKGPF